MSPEHLAQLVHRYGYREGEFTLSSGKKSNEYLDVKNVLLHPHAGFDIAMHISTYAGRGRVVAGMELGGAILAVILGQIRRSPVIVIRNKPREHGVKSLMVGLDNPVGDEFPTILVEDVITTGASVINALKALEHEPRLKVQEIIAVVDREEGGIEAIRKCCPVSSLTTISAVRRFRSKPVETGSI